MPKKKASEVTNADRHERTPLYFPQPYAPPFDWDAYIATTLGLGRDIHLKLAMFETLKAVLVRLRFKGELKLGQKDRDLAKGYDLTVETPEKGVLILRVTRAGDQ